MGGKVSAMQRLMLALMFTALVGCQSTGQVQPGPAEESVAESAEIAKNFAQSSPGETAIGDFLLQQAAQNTGAAEAQAERFDLSVQEMPAQAFFTSLVAGTDSNIVVHPEVSGAITLQLSDVTVSQVLSVVREIYGYEFKQVERIYTIFPRELRTQVFSIDYLDVQRVGVSDTSVAIGNISSGSGNSNRSNNSNNSNNSNSQNQTDLLSLASTEKRQIKGKGLSPGARIQTLNSTNFWGVLEQTLIAMANNAQEGRMVMVNPQAGLAVVKALPHELNAIRDFLERSELSVKRQVILETKILEVELREGFESGINWSAISGQLLVTNNVTDFQSPTDITGYEEIGEIFSSILKVSDITQLLSLLESQGSVQVLSSPRVSTVNNQKAVIRVGSDEFFVTGLSTDTVSNASSTTSTPDIELSSFFSGIALDVTPQIAEDGDVILHVHPVISTVQDQLKDFTIGDSQFSIPLALRDVRESDSIVRAKSGQVVVLGGLMQETSRRANTKRPIVGDVPLVNTLFKSKQDSRIKTELVILMRPVIVDDNDQWADDVERNMRRFNALGNEQRNLLGR